MEREKNRVLTLAEVLALPDGARVWVETNPEISSYAPMVHTFSTAESRSIREIKEPRLTDESGGWFPVCAEWVNDEYRVWSLPQPPTADELAAWPWPTEKEEA